MTWLTGYLLALLSYDRLTARHVSTGGLTRADWVRALAYDLGWFVAIAAFSMEVLS